MLNPTLQKYSAALHKADADRANLDRKVSQLEALKHGVYVGDDLIHIGTLVQKRRDIDLDAKRLAIQEAELTGQLADQRRLIDSERARLDKLAAADVKVAGEGMVLTVDVGEGRHVRAGDALASMVDCDQRFVVAIFSYRQGQELAVGSHVRVDDASFKSGTITSLLPKTSDKLEARYAVPFPQTERREMYAIVTPDAKGSEELRARSAGQVDKSAPCAVGKWVTVTRDGGAIVPSMSVAWRHIASLATVPSMSAAWQDLAGFATSELANLAKVWGPAAVPPRANRERRAGLARLSAKFHESPRDRHVLTTPAHWLPRTDAAEAK